MNRTRSFANAFYFCSCFTFYGVRLFPFGCK